MIFYERRCAKTRAAAKHIRRRIRRQAAAVKQDTNRIPRVMTIAGSDSGGGAGIQADLKAFAAHGVHGTSAITAVTAQNTVAVTDALALPPALVASQIDTVIDDIGADAVKTGMLPNAAIIDVVAQKARHHGFAALVVDPVMVTSAGDRLLEDDAVDAVFETLMPLALLVTPNTREAAVLTGAPVNTLADMRRAAKYLVESTGARAALVKGGHLDGPATDVLYDGGEFTEFTERRIQTASNHGTGCTLASSIAANLALGVGLHDAVANSKAYVTNAMRAASPIGAGHGPLNHFYMLDGVLKT